MRAIVKWKGLKPASVTTWWKTNINIFPIKTDGTQSLGNEELPVYFSYISKTWFRHFSFSLWNGNISEVDTQIWIFPKCHPRNLKYIKISVRSFPPVRLVNGIESKPMIIFSPIINFPRLSNFSQFLVSDDSGIDNNIPPFKSHTSFHPCLSKELAEFDLTVQACK